MFESHSTYLILLDLLTENKLQIRSQTRGDRSIIIIPLKYVGHLREKGLEIH